MKRGSQKMLVCQNVHRELSRLSLSATSPIATTLPPCINGVWIWKSKIWIWKSKICNLQSSCQLQPPSRPMYKWSGCAAGPRTKKEIASEMNCLGWECMQGSPARLSCISVCLSGQEETMDHSKECASCPDFIWDTPDYKSDQDTAYICNWPLCSKGDCLCCCLATINQAFIWSTLISIKCTHHIQVS